MVSSVSFDNIKNRDLSSSDTSRSSSDCTSTSTDIRSCSIYDCQHQHQNQNQYQYQYQYQYQRRCQQQQQHERDEAMIDSTGNTSCIPMNRIRRREESIMMRTSAFTIRKQNRIEPIESQLQIQLQIQSQSKRIHKINTILPVLVVRQQQQHMCSVIIILLVLIFQNEVTGFSTFLLTRSQCWTQLKENEIIMNQPIKSYSDTTDTQMIIKSFVASDGSISNESLIPHHLQSNPNIVLVPSGFPSVLSLHVVTTNTNTHPDYQWVMDVLVSELESGTTNDENTKPKAHFVDGSCTNRVRVAGRGDETVSITIEQDGAQVIVGWANGYEAVKLTQVVTFVNSTSSPNIPPNNINTILPIITTKTNKSSKDIVNTKIQNSKKIINDPQQKLDTEFQKKYGIGAIHEQLVQFRDRAIKEKQQQVEHGTSTITSSKDAAHAAAATPEQRSSRNHLHHQPTKQQYSNSDHHNQHFDRIHHQHKKIIKRDMDGSIIDTTTTNNHNHNNNQNHRDIKNKPKNNNNNMDDTFLHRQSIVEQEERIKESMLEDKISTNNDNNDNSSPHLYKHNYNKYDNQNHPFRIEFANLFGERQQQRERQQQQQQQQQDAGKSVTGIQSPRTFGITSSSYFYGCIILVISLYCSIHICIWASKRTTNTTTSTCCCGKVSTNSSIKGRLDL